MQQDVAYSPSNIAPESAAAASVQDRVAVLIGFAVLLALLYFGRGVLIPFTVALMLSLLINPLVWVLRQTGLGQTTSVLAAVLASALTFTAAAALISAQFLRVAESLPRYEDTIQQKLRQLDEVALGRLDGLTREASRLVESPAVGASGSRVAVEVHEPPANPFQILTRVIATVWSPIETSGIILMVLVFVLLEHEALRDRFIRLAGSTNIRLTTLALNDAGDRLSRFFVSQFVVNIAVGAAIALGLSFLGLPDAMLWAAFAAVLRSVPYIGIWSAASLSIAMAVAVVPGWSLAIGVLGIYLLVELIAAQVIEPHLYGHATGLSPLSIVIAAIFWSAIWGPVGLILSTPLTLCLLVIGRHITALSFLELLLADRQALTPPQRFYQRVLSGDADEIIATARTFLKRNSHRLPGERRRDSLNPQRPQLHRPHTRDEGVLERSRRRLAVTQRIPPLHRLGKVRRVCRDANQRHAPAGRGRIAQPRIRTRRRYAPDLGRPNHFKQPSQLERLGNFLASRGFGWDEDSNRFVHPDGTFVRRGEEIFAWEVVAADRTNPLWLTTGNLSDPKGIEIPA